MQMPIAPVRCRSLPIPQQLEYVRQLQERSSGVVVEVGGNSAAIERLGFDSACFGMSMGTIADVIYSEDDEEGFIASCVQSALQMGIDHLSIRIPSAEIILTQRLCDHGFILVDSLATLLHAEIDQVPSPAVRNDLTVSRVCIEDIEEVVRQSSSIYRHSRFFNDPHLGPEGAQRLFEEWVANNCKGRSDLVLTAKMHGELAGFVACRLDAQDKNFQLPSSAAIDLIAVFDRAQRKGVGTALVRGAIAHYQSKLGLMFVGTQGGNHPAMKLYQANNFKVIDFDLTFHWNRKTM